MRKVFGLSGLLAAGLTAAPALGDVFVKDRTVDPNDHLNDVGDCLLDSFVFTQGGDNLFGAKFVLGVDCTFGSGFGLVIDSFGSAVDTELALYNEDGTLLFAINDDFDADNNFDAYLAFGDAPQPDNPDNGTTDQGAFVNALELLAGTYIMIIGPFDTVWNESDMDLSTVAYRGGTEEWQCRACLVPTPGTLALLGLGGVVIGGRRRRA